MVYERLKMNVPIGVFLVLYVAWGLRKLFRAQRLVDERNAKWGTLYHCRISWANTAGTLLLYDPFTRVPVCAVIAYGVHLCVGGSLIPWQS